MYRTRGKLPFLHASTKLAVLFYLFFVVIYVVLVRTKSLGDTLLNGGTNSRFDLNIFFFFKFCYIIRKLLKGKMQLPKLNFVYPGITIHEW